MNMDYSEVTTDCAAPIRLLLVDDQILISQGLKTMLELEPDLQVIGIAGNGKMAIQQTADLSPDLVLMDVQMPVTDGRAAIREITQQFLEVKVLVLSTFDDEEYISDSIRAGARGYLLKDMPSDELIQAISGLCSKRPKSNDKEFLLNQENVFNRVSAFTYGRWLRDYWRKQ